MAIYVFQGNTAMLGAHQHEKLHMCATKKAFLGCRQTLGLLTSLLNVSLASSAEH